MTLKKIVKQNKIVLVVEDELPLQNAIKIKLEKNGFQVLTARSVEQAMNHVLDVEKIDVIWLDHYLLGEKTGLDFVITLKSDKKFVKIPIFVVSNTASSDKVKSYISLGATKYYTKANYRLEQIIEDMRKVID